jgi:hypothetical protein
MTPGRETVTTGVLTGLAGLAGLHSTDASAEASSDTTIDHDGERLTLGSAPEQVVRDRTGVSSGVERTVRQGRWLQPVHQVSRDQGRR